MTDRPIMTAEQMASFLAYWVTPRTFEGNDVNATAEAIVETVRPYIQALEQRVAELEARLIALDEPIIFELYDLQSDPSEGSDQEEVLVGRFRSEREATVFVKTLPDWRTGRYAILRPDYFETWPREGV
jgi:methionine synthase II (cobalamin-independent)